MKTDHVTISPKVNLTEINAIDKKRAKSEQEELIQFDSIDALLMLYQFYNVIPNKSRIRLVTVSFESNDNQTNHDNIEISIIDNDENCEEFYYQGCPVYKIIPCEDNNGGFYFDVVIFIVSRMSEYKQMKKVYTKRFTEIK